MAQLIIQQTVVVPANVPKSAPVPTALTVVNYEIESLDLEVPPGPQGLMGFYLARSGQQYIPYEAGEFIVWDDRFDSWVLDDQPTGGGWQLVAYNLDAVHTHAVVTRWHVNPLQLPPVSTAGVPVLSGSSTGVGVLL